MRDVRTRSVRAATVAAVLSLGVVVGLSVSAPASAEEKSQLASLSGTLHSSKGEAVVGAKVTAHLWPSNSVLASLQPGATFDTPIIAEAMTDGRGSFTLDLVRGLMTADSARGGARLIDIELTSVSSEGEIYSHDFTVDLGAALTSARDIDFSRAALTMPDDLSLSPVGHGDQIGDSMPSSGVVAADEDVFSKTGCSIYTVVSTHKDVKTTVGASFATKAGVVFDFTYGNGASNTLGVGVSVTGPSSGYSISGTTTVESDKSVSFGPQTSTTSHKKLYRTEFTYQKLRQVCTSNPNVVKYKYKFKPVAHEGGATVVNASSMPATASGSCDAYSKNASLTQSTSTSTTWTQGASTSGLIGSNLSSQAGYTSSVKMKATFAASAGKLCGTHGSTGVGGVPGSLKAIP